MNLQQLIENLDTAASDAIKVQELKSYLSSIPPEDAAWALFFFENRTRTNYIESHLSI